MLVFVKAQQCDLIHYSPAESEWRGLEEFSKSIRSDEIMPDLVHIILFVIIHKPHSSFFDSATQLKVGNGRPIQPQPQPAFQTFSFLQLPTSHNWYKTAATVGWSAWLEVYTVGTSLGLTGRASKLANPPTNQPTKTASCVRPGHQPAAGQILFTGTLGHQVVKAGLQPKKKKEAGKLINQLVRLSDQLINWPRYGCCCHKRENWIRPS